MNQIIASAFAAGFAVLLIIEQTACAVLQHSQNDCIEVINKAPLPDAPEDEAPDASLFVLGRQKKLPMGEKIQTVAP